MCVGGHLLLKYLNSMGGQSRYLHRNGFFLEERKGDIAAQ